MCFNNGGTAGRNAPDMMSPTFTILTSKSALVLNFLTFWSGVYSRIPVQKKRRLRIQVFRIRAAPGAEFFI